MFGTEQTDIMTRKRERKIPGTFLLAAVRSGDPWCKTMVSISKFVIKDNAIVCNEEVRCPVCGAELNKKDHVLRVFKKAGGSKEWYRIERRKCKCCGKTHRLLPDMWAPYKHYGAELIEDVIDEAVSEEDVATEDYPCEATMKRWCQWFEDIKENAEGYLRSAGYKVLDLSDEFLKSQVSLLEGLRDKLYRGWLRLTLRIMCNAGAVMRPPAADEIPLLCFDGTGAIG